MPPSILIIFETVIKKNWYKKKFIFNIGPSQKTTPVSTDLKYIKFFTQILKKSPLVPINKVQIDPLPFNTHTHITLTTQRVPMNPDMYRDVGPDHRLHSLGSDLTLHLGQDLAVLLSNSFTQGRILHKPETGSHEVSELSGGVSCDFSQIIRPSLAKETAGSHQAT